MSDRKTRVNVSINVRRGSHVICADVTKNPKSVWWYMIWEKKTLDRISGKNPKNLVFSWISHLHSKLYLGPKRPLKFIVVALLNPSYHRKRLIGKRGLMSLSVSDMVAMSFVVTWLKTLNQFGGLRFGKKTHDRIFEKNLKILVFLRISHLHLQLFLSPKRPFTFIVVAFLNPLCHRKCQIAKRELISLSMSDVATMSSVLT